MKNRNEIESSIIDHFSKKIEPYGFSLNEKKIKSEHYADYLYKDPGGIQYKLSIIFIKPNFLKYDNYLSVSSPETTEVIRSLDPSFNGEIWKILSIRLNSYLHPKNSDGYHNSNETIDKNIETEPDTAGIEDLSNDLFQTYFLPCINRIIPETNSLVKIDSLLNQVPNLMELNKAIKIRVHSETLVHQVLAGAIIAKLVDSPNYGFVAKRYLAYAEKFPLGKIGDIDLMRIFIEGKF